jgi:hypothetical protein
VQYFLLCKQVQNLPSWSLQYVNLIELDPLRR